MQRFLVLLVLGAVTCGESEEVQVNSRLFMEMDAAWRFQGGGCFTLTRGTAWAHAMGSRGDVLADMVVEERFGGTDLEIRATSVGVPVLDKKLTWQSLVSEELHEAALVSKAGKSYKLEYWGVQTCDPKWWQEFVNEEPK
jgi:hypothetical protein